ncbi:hypothetical protein SSAG_02957 [Streptomyces sp. Mg1]|nr:hypothetical protein SSAG_02957 [Streptomyces sp. Mg1]
MFVAVGGPRRHFRLGRHFGLRTRSACAVAAHRNAPIRSASSHGTLAGAARAAWDLHRSSTDCLRHTHARYAFRVRALKVILRSPPPRGRFQKRHHSPPLRMN